jgi:glucose/arabinose dehydrogenase
MKKSVLTLVFVSLWSIFIFSTCKQTAKKQTSNNTEKVVNEKPNLTNAYNLDKIKLPPGFKIELYAVVNNARSMCWGNKGTLFVGNRDGDAVYAVQDKDKDNYAETVIKIASGLNMPCGVAFKNGNLFVAEVNRILKFENIEDNLTKELKYSVVYNGYPTKKHHGWKFIRFGPDGKLYVPVGAPCNVCLEKDSVYASITRINEDGTGLEVFAHGVRNSVGFDFHPVTGELWFTENGRDHMGDDSPSCEINYAPTKGLHFGFPFYHQGNIADPDFGIGKSQTDYAQPAFNVGPHKAPLGMRFYTGNMFLPEYKNQIFVAEHGSWNRTTPIGYQVCLALMKGNSISQYVPFATGWLQPNGKVLGRPADVEVAADGALLVSDDDNGAIYRISFAN